MSVTKKIIEDPGLIITESKAQRLLALAWSAAEVAARQFITLGFSFGVLAFITPHDLGIFTLAYALNQIPSVLLDDPIIEALIQKQEATTRDWDTGFTANLILTAGALLISVLVSSWVAWLLHEPELRLALPAITLCSLLGSFGYVQKGFLARGLKFAMMAKTMLTSQIIAGVVGLCLAFAGYGYWALVGNLIVFTMANGILFWRGCTWKPRLLLDRKSLLALSNYAIHSISVRCVLLVRDNAPPLVVGIFFDATAIGYFALAFRISRTLGLFFEDMSRQPLMALMSREQANPRAFSQLLLDIVTVLGVAAIPAFVGLAMIGRYLPALVFGQVWAPSGELLPWLCGIVAGWVTLHVISVALRANGKVHLAFLLLAPLVGLDLGCLVLLAPYGIVWALIGMSIRMALSLPLLALVMRRWLLISVAGLLGRWMLPFAGVAAMSAAVITIVNFFGAGLAAIALACLCGGAIYAAIVGAGALILDNRIIVAAKAIG